MKIIRSVLAFYCFLTACSMPHAKKAYCDYAQLDGPEAELVVRSYYPNAVLTKIDTAVVRQVIVLFPEMLNNYFKNKVGGIEHILPMPLLFRAGQYRLQIVTFVDEEGRKLMLMNMLGLGHGTKIWRKHYYTINDGGVDNCLCIIDLNAKKILLAHCNGHG